jgi:hypothetical protein
VICKDESHITYLSVFINHGCAEFRRGLRLEVAHRAGLVYTTMRAGGSLESG